MNINFEIYVDFDKLESNLPKFECEFNFDGIEVYTKNKGMTFKYFSVISEVMSNQEVIAKARPKIIAIFDIISFLIGDSITIYDIDAQSYSVKPNKGEEETKSNKFIFENVDLSSQLRIILSKIESDRNTTLTLLDKWNKANYLLKVDDSRVLFLDEALMGTSKNQKYSVI